MARYTLTKLILACGLLAGVSCQSQTLDPFSNFKVEVVAEDLRVPWSIVFLPDGRMLFTERVGRVRIMENGVLQTKPVLTIESIENTKKMGLLGMTIHPEFKRNGWIYLAYNYKAAQQNRLRVDRYRFDGKQLVDPKTILENIPANQNHSGCRLLFGPDHKLYITTGDADVPGQAQEPGALNGKILRLNDDGSIPDGNPFVGESGARAEVWSYGHRNPQGLYFQPGTGYLFDTEHGPNGGDEINRIVKGGNYGWPLVHHQDERAGMQSPLLEFTPSIGPGSAFFYEGAAFPELEGDLLVACLRGEAILRVDLNGAQVLKHEFLLKNQYGRIREVVAGPDGYIYFSTSQHDPPEGQPKPGYDKIFRLIPAKDPADGNTVVAGNTVLEKSKDPVSVKESVRNEQSVFQQLCANCHGGNLQGTAAAGSLVDGIWKFGGAEKAIFFSIKKGHPEAGMPAWEGALTDKQIKRLVDFIVQEAQ